MKIKKVECGIERMEARSNANAFLAEVELDFNQGLFEQLPDVFYFIKDKQRRLVKVNSAFLKLFGYADEEEVLGLTDADIFGREQARMYEYDDDYVLRTGQAIINRHELVSSASGVISQHVTNKVSVRNRLGEVVGVAGISRDFTLAQNTVEPYRELKPVIDKIDSDYGGDLQIEELIKIINMSASTFLRRFKENMGMPPIKYIKKVRLSAACRLLIKTRRSVSEIARDCGFCDQSYMTREFKKIIGVSPIDYRKKYC